MLLYAMITGEKTRNPDQLEQYKQPTARAYVAAK
jgi:hypothetical protein